MYSTTKLLLLAAFAALCHSSAQAQSPMVAYRKGLEWHFYNSQNKLLFPVNKLIAPSMVTSFQNGYARVRVPVGADKDKGVLVGQALIDERGKIQDLALPSKGKITWRIASVNELTIAGKKEHWAQVFNSENGCGYLYCLERKQLVPSAGGLSRFNYIANGIAVGYGAQPTLPDDKNPLKEYELYNGEEQNFEIWNLARGTKSCNLKAQEIAFVENSRLLAQNDNLWGIATVRGAWEVAPKYKDVGYTSLVEGDIDTDGWRVRVFYEGVLAATIDGVNWGLIDWQGNWQVQPTYNWISYTGNGTWLGEDAEGYRVVFNAKGKLYSLSKVKNDALDPTKASPSNNNSKQPQVAITTPYMYEDSPLLFTVDAITQKEYVFNTQTDKIVYSCSNCAIHWLDKQHFMVIPSDDKSTVDIYDNTGNRTAQWNKLSERIYHPQIVAKYGLILAYDPLKSLYGFVGMDNKWRIEPTFSLETVEESSIITKNWLYFFHNGVHQFYDHSGKLLRNDSTQIDTDWDMMSPLLSDEGWGFE